MHRRRTFDNEDDFVERILSIFDELTAEYEALRTSHEKLLVTLKDYVTENELQIVIARIEHKHERDLDRVDVSTEKRVDAQLATFESTQANLVDRAAEREAKKHIADLKNLVHDLFKSEVERHDEYRENQKQRRLEWMRKYTLTAINFVVLAGSLLSLYFMMSQRDAPAVIDAVQDAAKHTRPLIQ